MGYERNDRRYGRDQSYGYRPEGRDRSDERGYDRSEDLSYNRDRGYGSGQYSAGRVDYGRDGPAARDYGRDAGRDPRNQNRDDDRGFFDRAGDEVRSWFGDEEAERRRNADEARDQRDYERNYGRDEDRSRYGRETSGRDVRYAGTNAGYGTSGIPSAGYGWNFRDDDTRVQRDRQDSQQQRQDHDPHYRSWRDRQMQSFDRDYEDYRSEKQKGFDTDFHGWRSQRETQRGSLGQVKEHQEIVGSDDQHVGTVDKVRGDRIILTKTDQDAGNHHHSIPSSWIRSVDDKVTISKTADEAHKHWKDEETNSAFGQDRNRDDNAGSTGAHNLNRSFSGTY